jgi:hypothetical protein
MSVVGLYSKIQYLEALINDVKNSQVSTDVSTGVSGSGDMANVPDEKVIDLTQMREFNELSEKVSALQVADGELSAKVAEVPTILSSYVSATDFASLNTKVEKMEKLNTQMDKLNSKLDSLISKVSSLESKVATLESQTPA